MTETSDGATASTTSSSSTSWWGSWIEVAKEKSAQTIEFMKRDITEFTDTVQHDTASVVSSTAAMLREKLNVETGSTALEKAKEGLSNFLGTITDGLSNTSQPDEEKEIIIIQDSEPVLLDRNQAEIYAVQTDPDTFCREPSGPPELYEKWLMTFNIEDHQEQLSELMIHRTEMRNLYSKLVPSAVSHNEFWNRYYYRLLQLKEAEARRAALMRRADPKEVETELDWDDVADEEPTNTTVVSNGKDGEKNSVEKEVNGSSKNVVVADAKVQSSTAVSQSAPSSNESQLNSYEGEPSLKTKETDDMVVVGTASPILESGSSSGSSTKGSSAEEDWEKSFEISEEEMKQVETTMSKTNKPKDDNIDVDEWETWE